jgi:hypothetical protein
VGGTRHLVHGRAAQPEAADHCGGRVDEALGERERDVGGLGWDGHGWAIFADPPPDGRTPPG